MKICSKCKIEKHESEFNKHKDRKDGLRSRCKDCFNIYYLENIEHKKQLSIDYYNTHKEERNNYNSSNKNNKKLYAKKKYQENKESINNINRSYRIRNIDKVREQRNNYVKNRILSNNLYKLIGNIRSLINMSFRKYDYTKTSKTANLLACSFQEFQNHLGPKPSTTHQLDHICPCAQANDKEELIKLQHYSNFRWLSVEENLKKSDHRTLEGEELCKSLLSREWVYK